MSESYSTYDAKSKFSELLRKVRAGRRIRITYRGRDVAESSPVGEPDTMDDTVRRLEEDGVLGRAPSTRTPLVPLDRRPGALERFLDSRE